VAFKTQAIHVPTQAVVQHSLEEASSNASALSPDESNPKNKKNQTITELISLLKHHNWHHRKDAMTEITMLLHAHPKALNRIQGSLLETMASLFLDDESPVRKACLAFLSSVLSLIDEVCSCICCRIEFLIC
jgi:hypothetical protein